MTSRDSNGEALSALRKQLSQAQVDAACTLFEQERNWQLELAALRSLRERFPSNCDPVQVLPKAATLNSLYATRIFAITDMASHIADIFRQTQDAPREKLVECVARLSLAGKTWRFLSFASKYCHFFVDHPQGFPIMDSYAQRAVEFHLGRKAAAREYHRWVELVDGLRDAGGLSCSYADLDHYLWLRGEWLVWKSQKPVNPRAQRLFKSSDPETRALVRQAFSP